MTNQKEVSDLNKGRVQGAVMAIGMLLDFYDQPGMAESIYRELGVKWNELVRKYHCSDYDMSILRKYKKDLTKRERAYPHPH